MTTAQFEKDYEKFRSKLASKYGVYFNGNTDVSFYVNLNDTLTISDVLIKEETRRGIIFDKTYKTAVISFDGVSVGFPSGALSGLVECGYCISDDVKLASKLNRGEKVRVKGEMKIHLRLDASFTSNRPGFAFVGPPKITRLK